MEVNDLKALAHTKIDGDFNEGNLFSFSDYLMNQN